MDNKKTHFCEPCFFSTNNKADFVRHCQTNKHFLRCNKNHGLMDNKKTQKNALSFTCECGKAYKFKSGLCKHKKSCVYGLNNSFDISKNFMDNDLTDFNNNVYYCLYLENLYNLHNKRNYLQHPLMYPYSYLHKLIHLRFRLYISIMQN